MADLRQQVEALALQLFEGGVDEPGPGNPDFLWSRAEAVAVLLATAADATPYIRFLEELADEISAAPQSRARFVPFWNTLPLPVPNRLDLLRRLVILDDYYGNREKDWDRSPDAHVKDTMEIVSEDPDDGFPALGPWLSDQRPTAGGEASVAEAAMGILCRLRQRYPHFVWQTLVDHLHEVALLLYRLQRTEPQWVCDMLAADHERLSDDAFVQLINRIAQTDLDLPDVLLDDLQRRFDAGSPGVPYRSSMLTILIRYRSRPEYDEELLQGYLDGARNFTASLLRPTLEGNPQCVRRLAGVLEDPERTRTLVTSLSLLSGDSDAAFFADELLADLLIEKAPMDPIDPTLLTIYAENRLQRSTTASPMLRRVMSAIIPCCIGHRFLLAALLRTTSLSADPAARSELLDEMLAAHPPGLRTQMLLDELEYTSSRVDGLGQRALEAARAAPVAERDRALVMTSTLNDLAFQLLRTWVDSGALTDPGLLLRYIAAVERGDDRSAAARQVFELE